MRYLLELIPTSGTALRSVKACWGLGWKHMEFEIATKAAYPPWEILIYHECVLQGGDSGPKIAATASKASIV